MISAIILAAGESKRMGEQKLLMKWGDSSVIEHVLRVFLQAGVDEIAVITGSHRDEIEKVVSALKKIHPVKCVFNENFSSGEMLSSIQCGLRELASGRARAAMIGLGDQPQVRERSVRMVCETFRETGSPLVVPSFNKRRGHPWLVERTLWKNILAMRTPQTPRDFLNFHADQIEYVDVDDAGILADLDTPDQYRAYEP
jgi:molybdenum cofactor cytidylyltransferase